VKRWGPADQHRFSDRLVSHRLGLVLFFCSVFEAAATDLDELTETVTSYISFCEDMCILTRTHLTYNNDKPWFTAKLRQLRQAKEDSYRNGDRVLYKQAKYTLEKEIKVAKRNYSEKLRNQFYSSDSSSVWKGLKDITN